MSLQQKEIDIEDAIAIRSMKDINQAETLSSLEVEKSDGKAARDCYAELSDAKDPVSSTGCSGRLGSQAKMQEMQMEAQLEAQQLQLKSQLEAQLEQVKHQFRKEIELIKAQATLGFRTEEQEQFKEKARGFKRRQKR